VQYNGKDLGRLVDVVIGPAGELRAMLVDQHGRTVRMPHDGRLTVAPKRRTAA
jgi:hypothetical protein